MTTAFIAKHGLRTADEQRLAAAFKTRVEKEGLRLVRLAWADAHGYVRAKAVTVPAFFEALSAGYNINVATTTLDSANARTFSSFTRGGGMGLDEMTGSPNITIVPDPATFRVLPWAPGVGWMLCDEYFNSGAPYPFSPRHVLRQAARAPEGGRDSITSSGSRSSGISPASPRSISPTSTSACPASAAVRSRPGRSSRDTRITRSPTSI